MEKLTKHAPTNHLKAVNPLRRFSALLLLALWLAATQHCALEAAGLWDFSPEKDACCSDGRKCAYDDCETVERGSAPSLNGTVKVPSPNLDFCVCVLFEHVVTPSPVEDASGKFSNDTDQLSDSRPPWQFERRAAQSPRAPSLIQA